MKNLLTIFITALFMNCSAQFTYPEYHGYFEGEYLYPCDFDQDGTTDFMNTYGRVCLNQLDPLNSQLIDPVFGGIYDAPVDVNGDSFPDVLYLKYNNQTDHYMVYLAINDQNNGVTSTVLADSIDYTPYTEFTDFDLDGDTDIQVNQGYFVNDGSGAFTYIDWGNFPGFLCNYSNDGYVDRIEMVADTIFLFEGLPDYQFNTPAILYIVPDEDYISIVDVMDWDSDGDLDILAYYSIFLSGNTSLALLENDGGNLNSPVAIYVDNGGIVKADMDSDGDEDLIGLNFYSSSWIYVYENTGLFEPIEESYSYHIQEGFSSYEVQNMGYELYDLDVDGDLDILIQGRDYIPVTYVYYNQGNFNFSPPICLSGAGAITDMGMADINLDNRLDLTFEMDYEILARGFMLMDEELTQSRKFFGPIAQGQLGNFNNDSFPDEVIRHKEQVLVFNYPPGDYSAPAFTIDIEAKPIVTTDLNADGLDDMIIRVIADSSLQVFISDGPSNWTENTMLSALFTSSGADLRFAKDCNNDGIEELVYKTGMMYNDNFAFTFYPFPAAIQYFTLSADVNNDGTPEFLGLTEDYYSVFLKSEAPNEWIISTEVTSDFLSLKLPYDFDLDGDLDLVGANTIDENIDGYFSLIESLEYPFYDEMNSGLVTDIDNDSDLDCVVLQYDYVNTNYLSSFETVFQQDMLIAGKLFIDANANGLYDTGELGVPMRRIEIDSSASAYTWSNGQYTYTLLAEGNYSVVAPSITHWQYSTAQDSLVDITIPNTMHTNVNFGVTPVEIVTEIETTFGVFPHRCNANHGGHLFMHNTGTTTPDCKVTLVIPDEVSLAYASLPISYTNGDSIVWNIDSIAPFQFPSIYFHFNSPGVEFIDSVFTYQCIIESYTDGVLVNTNVESHTQTQTCAYDPNDITEYNGWGDEGFILNGDELLYTIRFQNTGNAPAEDVRVENQLSEFLQWNTLQPVAWSHDFNLTIDELGRATFTFDQIMLPDSTTNELESHGFITYSISAVAELLPLTEIENTADIYFDFNPAVVTNTEVNTIFDCSLMEGLNIMDASGCAGGTLLLQNAVPYSESYTWTIDDQLIATTASAEYLMTEAGTHTLVQTAGNPLCEVEYGAVLIVSPTPDAPAIIQNGNMLTATGSGVFVWSLNGEVIAGANNNTLEITQSGNYSVVLASNEGCLSDETSGDYTYIGLSEWGGGSIALYPNPASDFITVKMPSSMMAKEMTITNAVGQVVMKMKVMKETMQVDVSGLAKGVYTLQVGTVVERMTVE
jgi:uncharacterized repeat protein (TIGR01451 family)